MVVGCDHPSNGEKMERNVSEKGKTERGRREFVLARSQRKDTHYIEHATCDATHNNPTQLPITQENDIMPDESAIHLRHYVRHMWKIHFSIGLVVLCFGMMCNGGR